MAVYKEIFLQKKKNMAMLFIFMSVPKMPSEPLAVNEYSTCLARFITTALLYIKHRSTSLL